MVHRPGTLGHRVSRALHSARQRLRSMAACTRACPGGGACGDQEPRRHARGACVVGGADGLIREAPGPWVNRLGQQALVCPPMGSFHSPGGVHAMRCRPQVGVLQGLQRARQLLRRVGGHDALHLANEVDHAVHTGGDLDVVGALRARPSQAIA